MAATLKALVIAGGWWGGIWYWWGGGGGAWWLLYDSALLVTPQSYTITIGNWWTGANNTGFINWTNWGDSIFSSLTAIWWAWVNWAQATSTNWRTGGSWSWWHWGWTGWAWTAWQGYAWWWSESSANYGWGWWGGAGWVWWNGTTSVAGASGAAVSNSISGTAINYSLWWKGWISWQSNAWLNWANNTGNWGWGASDWYVTWWNGWSGIVIISYATNGSDWVSPSSTGGTITTSWGQTIHTFTTSGTFTMVASTNSAFLMFM